MGGSFFSPELYTPRMPPSVYRHIRDTVHTKLHTLYVNVSTPIEAPGKDNYGDVDVLVFEKITPHDETNVDNFEECLSKLLNAKACKHDKGSNEFHVALHWPTPSELGATTAISIEKAEKTPEKFIQLDLRICTTLFEYKWHEFSWAHGDFWTITGSILRRYGLSFRDSGLYVRIEEIEKVNKKLSLVKLSTDPAEVLRFVISDKTAEERFWRPDAFENIDEMCDFIRRYCRFYRPPKERDEKTEVEPQPTEEENGNETETVKKSSVQPNKERTRFRKRGRFLYWLDEYLPRHGPADREAGRQGEYADLSREEVVEMVKERFGVAAEYDDQRRIGLRQRGVETFWADLKVNVVNADPPLLVAQQQQKKKSGSDEVANANMMKIEPGFVVRTLRKKLSVEAREKPDDQLDNVQKMYRSGEFEELNAWVHGNWRRVAEEKYRENLEKSRVQYKAKMEKLERERRDADDADAAAAVAPTPAASIDAVTDVPEDRDVDKEVK